MSGGHLIQGNSWSSDSYMRMDGWDYEIAVVMSVANVNWLEGLGGFIWTSTIRLRHNIIY